MKRHVIFSVLMLFLTFNIAGALADYDTLYVDGFDSTETTWTETGSPPYLWDTDTDLVYASLQNQYESWFSFASSSASGVLNSVYLYVEVQQDSSGDDQTDLYLRASGVSQTLAGSVVPPDTGYEWRSVDVSTVLNTWDKINSAELRLASVKVGPKFESQYVRRAYLYVDYIGGTDYRRDLSLSLSTIWSKTRYYNAGREPSLVLDLQPVTIRSCDFVRIYDLDLGFAVSIFTDLIGDAIDYLRVIGLDLQVMVDSFPITRFVRDFGLGLNFLVKYFTPLGGGGGYAVSSTLIYFAVILFIVGIALMLVMGEK